MQKSMKRYFPIFVLPTLIAFTIGGKQLRNIDSRHYREKQQTNR